MNKIKVKIPGLPGLKNKKLTYLFVGTTAIIFLLILLKWWLSRGDQTGFLGSIPLFESNEAPESTEVFFANKAAPKVKIQRNRKELRRLKFNALGISRGALNYKATQELMLQEFKKTLHLRMKFPEGLHYVEPDLEDGVAGIIGTTTDLKESFAVLGTAQKVSLDQATGWLKENEGAFPMVQGREFIKEKSFEFTPSEATGLGTMTIIPATTRDDKGLYAVLAPRKDEKGTYLFMMEADANYFEENEDGFEKMLDGLSALP